MQLNRQDVKYRMGDTLVNTGTDHFGAAANSIIQAGTLLGKCSQIQYHLSGVGCKSIDIL